MSRVADALTVLTGVSRIFNRWSNKSNEMEQAKEDIESVSDRLKQVKNHLANLRDMGIHADRFINLSDNVFFLLQGSNCLLNILSNSNSNDICLIRPIFYNLNAFRVRIESDISDISDRTSIRELKEGCCDMVNYFETAKNHLKDENMGEFDNNVQMVMHQGILINYICIKNLRYLTNNLIQVV